MCYTILSYSNGHASMRKHLGKVHSTNDNLKNKHEQ